MKLESFRILSTISAILPYFSEAAGLLKFDKCSWKTVPNPIHPPTSLPLDFLWADCFTHVCNFGGGLDVFLVLLFLRIPVTSFAPHHWWSVIWQSWSELLLILCFVFLCSESHDVHDHYCNPSLIQAVNPKMKNSESVSLDFIT